MAQNDVRSNGSPPATPPQPRRLSFYKQFVKTESDAYRRNAQAYQNKLVARNDPRRQTGLRKVLKGATFVPAHETRFRAGAFNTNNVTHFVVHRPGTSAPSCTLLNVIKEFSQENRKASTHFIIGYNGELVQMVDLEDVAYHTGDAKIQNQESIGVELEGPVNARFTSQQIFVLAKLLRTLEQICPKFTLSRHISSETNKVDLERSSLVGHSEIWPAKKTDPGENFPYNTVIKIASALPTPTRPFYQPPIDLSTSASRAVREILASAADPTSSFLNAVYGQAASDAAALMRTTDSLFENRQTLAYNASREAVATSNYQIKTLATYLRLEEQLSDLEDKLPRVPSSDPRVRGVRFDFATRLWNDGKVT